MSRKFKDGAGKFTYYTKISDNMRESEEGYLYCDNAVLGNTGDLKYRASEIFEDGDSKEVIIIKRIAEEVFKDESLATLKGKSVTNQHPEQFVDINNVKEYEAGTVFGAARGENDLMIGDLVVKDKKTIGLIKDGKLKCLSLGYNADLVFEDGDLVQRNIRYNHCAVVKQGRQQHARLVDSAIEETTVLEMLDVEVEDAIIKNTYKSNTETETEYNTEDGSETTTRIEVTQSTRKVIQDEEEINTAVNVSALDEETTNNETEELNVEKDLKYFIDRYAEYSALPESELKDKAIEDLDEECKEILKVSLKPKKVEKVEENAFKDVTLADNAAMLEKMKNTANPTLTLAPNESNESHYWQKLFDSCNYGNPKHNSFEEAQRTSRNICNVNGQDIIEELRERGLRVDG